MKFCVFWSLILLWTFNENISRIFGKTSTKGNSKYDEQNFGKNCDIPCQECDKCDKEKEMCKKIQREKESEKTSDDALEYLDCKKNCNNGGNCNQKYCLEVIDNTLKSGSHNNILQSLKDLEDVLIEDELNETTFVSDSNIIAALYKQSDPFHGLEMYANDTKVNIGADVRNRKVKISLPRELNVEQNDMIMFSTIHLPNETGLRGSDELYGRMLIGLRVRGRNVSGLQERVNITITTSTSINETQEPQCVFLNTSANDSSVFNSEGCETIWGQGQDYIICSCDHFTQFGVLLVPASQTNLSLKDQEILSYITIIGCSISLFALVITVLIFVTNRKLREDDSKKIHISLAVALILLNLHFLPNETVAAGSSTQFCLYMALGLHYSLLATFSWMALEGLHLYLLLVKVFNIYVRRYLLKLSVVGWGVPAVIVSVVVIIDRNYYGHTPLDVSKPNGSAICYITNDTVQMVTTLGVFSLMFLFNVIMFGVTARWFMASLVRRKSQVQHRDRKAARREIFSILSIMVLLGITWGLIFFSFGALTTPGLYAFCILNSLQGFFIFTYFVLSLKKTKASAAQQSSKTQTDSSRT